MFKSFTNENWAKILAVIKVSISNLDNQKFKFKILNYKVHKFLYTSGINIIEIANAKGNKFC